MSSTFGRYLILKELGMGGMASVDYAQDQDTGEYVALKRLHIHLATDPSIVQRFIHESRIAVKLDHPNIVKVVDSGMVEKTPYIALEYLDGGSLAQLFKKTVQLSVKRIVNILGQVGSGLDYAHTKGIVHRDVKLENVLRSQTGRIALADFGIARIASETRLTSTGMIIGTPHYMPPEQIQGEKNIDHRADLYAFSVMSYLLLTGFFPFRTNDLMQLVKLHLSYDPPAPSQLNPQLPPALDRVLLKGLAKDREERYNSAREIVAELSSILVPVYEARTTIQMAIPHSGNYIELAPKKEAPSPPIKLVQNTSSRASITLSFMLLLAILAFVSIGGWYYLQSREESLGSPVFITREVTAPSTLPRDPTATQTAIPVTLQITIQATYTAIVKDYSFRTADDMNLYLVNSIMDRGVVVFRESQIIPAGTGFIIQIKLDRYYQNGQPLDLANTFFTLDAIAKSIGWWGEIDRLQSIRIETVEGGTRAQFVEVPGQAFRDYYYIGTLTQEEFEQNFTIR